MTQLADKIEVRKYINEKLGQGYCTELVNVYNKPEDIEFENLPERCVIKSNHASGQVIFYTKGVSNQIEIINECKKWLSQKYCEYKCEWAYSNIEPKIVIEKLLIDKNGEIPNDYKVFVADGRVLFIQVDTKRFSGHLRSLFNSEWELIDVEYCHKSAGDLPRPENLVQMVDISKKLAEGHPFLRVDFYSVNNKLYIGELTFYPESGMGSFEPIEYDLQFGDMLAINGLSK